MSSLLLSASVWKNEDNETHNTNKKRTPTLRRPENAPLHPPIHNDFSRDIKTDAKESKEMSASSIDKIYKDFEANVDDVKSANIDRNSRIDELLNKITAADNNNEKMGNFKPLGHPSVQVKGDYENAELPKYNPKLPSFAAATIQMRHGDAEYSNYAQSYEPPRNQYVSRDTNVHNTNATVGVVDKKLLEKINYLIHMMEQQKNEKTSNITEEFILYTFLGVFIIYVIDSFARVGKYTR